MEKVISTQLMEYLENNNLLNESKYAYRNNSSTEQAPVNVTEQIYKSIDKGKISLLVLDLSKAFDSVNHELLLNKLVQLNIDSTWFASYLHDMTHSVKIDKIMSEANSNLYGVPHLSILGPILFNIFINDITKINSLPEITTSTTIYADDVQLLFSGTPYNLEQLKIYAETSRKRMKEWYNENGLKMNLNKTRCILFATPNFNKRTETFQITIDDTVMHTEDKVKNLGVIFDSCLSFEHHIKSLCFRLNGTLSYLNRVN